MRESEGMSVEEKLKAVTHAVVIITRYNMVHDSKTAYQRIKEQETRQQDAAYSTL